MELAEKCDSEIVVLHDMIGERDKTISNLQELIFRIRGTVQGASAEIWQVREIMNMWHARDLGPKLCASESAEVDNSAEDEPEIEAEIEEAAAFEAAPGTTPDDLSLEIAELGELLKTRAAELQAINAALQYKDAELLQRDAEIEHLQKALAETEAEVAQHRNAAEQKQMEVLHLSKCLDAEVKDKHAELQQKIVELLHKDEELQHLQSIVAEKDAEIVLHRNLAEQKTMEVEHLSKRLERTARVPPVRLRISEGNFLAI